MSNSYLNELRHYDRRTVMEAIERMLPIRRLPKDTPHVPCPDSRCRQWRLYFQTDKLGRPDCPVCAGHGWVPVTRVAPSKLSKKELHHCPEPDRTAAENLSQIKAYTDCSALKPSTGQKDEEADSGHGRLLPLFKEVAE